MKTIGIIAEYNPFHLGHAHQLASLAQQEPDAIRLIVMSGAFVQRGGPALFSKFDRAHWAILGGADVVIELPTLFASASAEIFADGGVRLLGALGVNALSFGSEIADLALLHSAVKASQDPAVQETCQVLLQQGLYYGAALRQAISQHHPEVNAIMTSPNALLGLEYMRALAKYNFNMDIIPIERQSQHHAQGLSQDLPSGTALRNYILQSDTPWGQWQPSYKRQPLEQAQQLQEIVSDSAVLQTSTLHQTQPLGDLQNYIHPQVLPLMQKAIQEGRYSLPSRYEDMVLLEARRSQTDQLKALQDFTEGLHNKWLEAASQRTWTQARELIKSKRYSYARLDRMAAYSLLGISKELFQEAKDKGPTYARLLAFNDRGRQWLRQQDAQVPIIKKWAPFYKEAQGFTQESLRLDALATDIQALSFAHQDYRQGHQDYTYSPVFVRDETES